MDFDIVETGSKGNALVLNATILIDCGIPFKKLEKYYKNLNLVLLTHVHGDHFNKATVRKLAQERPTLRFGCAEWLVSHLVENGVSKLNIDVYEMDTVYDYKIFKIKPFPLVHNVPNCGYRILINGKKILYATDTNTIKHVQAKGYDLYFIEANYTEENIKERIKEKQSLGIYTYELQALKNHLSKEKCDNWLYENMSHNSRFIYMHKNETVDF